MGRRGAHSLPLPLDQPKSLDNFGKLFRVSLHKWHIQLVLGEKDIGDLSTSNIYKEQMASECLGLVASDV